MTNILIKCKTIRIVKNVKNKVLISEKFCFCKNMKNIGETIKILRKCNKI